MILSLEKAGLLEFQETNETESFYSISGNTEEGETGKEVLERKSSV